MEWRFGEFCGGWGNFGLRLGSNVYVFVGNVEYDSYRSVRSCGDGYNGYGGIFEGVIL